MLVQCSRFVTILALCLIVLKLLLDISVAIIPKNNVKQCEKTNIGTFDKAQRTQGLEK